MMKRPKRFLATECLRKKLAPHGEACVAGYIAWRQSLLDAGEKPMQPLKSLWSVESFIAGFLAGRQ